MPIASQGQVEKRSGGEGTLASRYASVKERIAAAAQRSGRTRSDVLLVAVTKNAAIDDIRELIRLGHADFGENRVPNLVQRAAQIDEFMQRHRQLTAGRELDLPRQVRWHMIGHLQRNKVRKILGFVRLIHSVDSLRLAEEIQGLAGRLEEPVEVLVQVNVAGEKQKFGVAPPAVRHLLDQIDTMMNLRARGLMCMAPLVEDREVVRPVFERCRELFDELRRGGAGGERFDILSMGMSGDFEVAVECGANMVRVGSAIFGDVATETVADEEE
jgi:hypothetical protein